jgi:predicted HTH domain antitoxin
MLNYADMSLVELKQIAKERRYIKLYYVLPKDELVRILSLPEPPLGMKLSKMTIKQLREEAKQRGIHGFWNLSRADLLQLLYPSVNNKTSTHKDQQDQGYANEHNDPQGHDSQ